MSQRLACPRCGEQLYAWRGGEWTLRTTMIKLAEDGGVTVRCPAGGCTEDVAVPFLRADPPGPAPTAAPRRARLVVRVPTPGETSDRDPSRSR